jgi:hypothetical protein
MRLLWVVPSCRCEVFTTGGAAGLLQGGCGREGKLHGKTPPPPCTGHASSGCTTTRPAAAPAAAVTPPGRLQMLLAGKMRPQSQPDCARPARAASAPVGSPPFALARWCASAGPRLSPRPGPGSEWQLPPLPPPAPSSPPDPAPGRAPSLAPRPAVRRLRQLLRWPCLLSPTARAGSRSPPRPGRAACAGSSPCRRHRRRPLLIQISIPLGGAPPS